LAALGAWLSLALALAAWGLLYLGDSWAPATVLLFGPRWLLAAPPLLVLIPAGRAGRWSLIAAVAALVIVLGPVMEFNVPWAAVTAAPTGGPRLRVLTCNLHYGGNATAVEAVVASAGPDVVALQEWREPTGANAPRWEGWHIQRMPGLFLASRFPVRRADHLGRTSTRGNGSAARYDLDTPAGPATVISLHLASPREDLKGAVLAADDALDGLAANSALRDRQSEFIAAAAGEATGPVLVVGDFNAPSESVVFRRHWGEYRDAFADAGWAWGYTFRNRWTRVRIDHILVGGGGRAEACWVGPDLGSPHRPVLADVTWPAGR
jgi:endonuclease/exonuclease/phosphatase family metal-dependent hydrolase